MGRFYSHSLDPLLVSLNKDDKSKLIFGISNFWVKLVFVNVIVADRRDSITSVWVIASHKRDPNRYLRTDRLTDSLREMTQK